MTRYTALAAAVVALEMQSRRSERSGATLGRGADSVDREPILCARIHG